MTTVLVTGATGFVGRSLVRVAAAKGYHVVAAHRTGANGVDLLRDSGAQTEPADSGEALRRLVETIGPDTVVHLAAHQSRRTTPQDVAAFVAANIEYGTQLLQALVGSSAVVVSAMSYFQFRGGQPIAHSLYAATKQAFSQIEKYYRRGEGVDIRDVVLFDNYGAHDTRDKLIPTLLAAARADIPAVTGSAAQELDLLHVDDVASGLLAAGAPGAPEIMAVRAERLVTVGDIVAAVEEVSGRELRIEVDPRRPVSDQPRYAGEWPAPAGWVPSISLRDGLGASWGGRDL